jgi:hypothetical protein
MKVSGPGVGAVQTAAEASALVADKAFALVAALSAGVARLFFDINRLFKNYAGGRNTRFGPGAATVFEKWPGRGH